MEKTLTDLKQHLQDTVQSIFYVQQVAITIDQEMRLLRKKAELVDELLTRNSQLEKLLTDCNVNIVQHAVDVGPGPSDWPSGDMNVGSPTAGSSSVSGNENIQFAELRAVVIKEEPIDQSIIDNGSITIDTGSTDNQPINDSFVFNHTTNDLQQYSPHQSPVVDQAVAASSKVYLGLNVVLPPRNSSLLESQPMVAERDVETDQSQNRAPSNEPPIRCTKCSFETFVPYSLTLHMRQRHVNKKVHKCPMCPYETVYPHDLKRHMSYNSCRKSGPRL